MPTVKDKTTGDVVSRQPYTAEGTQRAEQIAESDPTWEIDYAPAGEKDAPSMREQMYAGGGKTGYSAIGMYKKGGKVAQGTKPGDWEATQAPLPTGEEIWKECEEYKPKGKKKSKK